MGVGEVETPNPYLRAVKTPVVGSNCAVRPVCGRVPRRVSQSASAMYPKIHEKSSATSRLEGQEAQTDRTATVLGNNCAAVTVPPELGTKIEASNHDY